MSSGNSFDPSREWLGIDAVDLADPRLVLGLPPGPITREAIIAAADVRLSKLRGLEAGPFTVARTALIRRVEESRDGLLASLPTARTASGFAPPPPPGAVPTPARRPPGPQPNREARHLRPSPPSPAPACPAEVTRRTPARERGPGPTGRISPARRRSWSLPLLTVSIAAAAALAVYNGLVPSADRLLALAREKAPGFVDLALPTDVPPATTTRPPGPRGRPVSPSATGGAEQSPTRPQMIDEPASNAVRISTPAGAVETAPRETSSPRPEPTPQSQRAPQPPEHQPPLPAVVPQPVAQQPREQPPRPVARESARIDDLLAGARAALAAGKFDKADDWLARARDAVGDGPGADRVAGWEQLAAHARKFATFRGQALKAGAGREFDVGRDQISVIEVTDRMFIFRHEGQNKRLPLDAVPEAIAMTMTKKWLAGGGHAANHLFIGARYLTRPEPDAAAARKSWLAAQQGGEDVSLLVPLLDDPLFRGPPARR